MRKFLESTCWVFLLLLAWTNVSAAAVSVEGYSSVACHEWSMTEHATHRRTDREQSASNENKCQSPAESCCEMLCAESSAPLALLAPELKAVQLSSGRLQIQEPFSPSSPIYLLDKPPQ